jgi:hypothetical protein
MVDSTAGIGEAGALINKANAPAGLDITRGIQMAQRNALKKAQLEAAKAAKLQAVKDKMGKVSRVDVGKYKNVGVSKEANEKGRELAARKYLAYVNDDVEEQMNLDREVSTLQDYYTSKDNTVSTLKGKKNYEYVQKAGEAIDAGNLDEASKYNKPYAPVYTQGQMGDFIVQAPEATDLGKIYSTVLKTAAHNDIKFSSLADAATNTDNYSINRKMTPDEISNYTTELLKSEGYAKSVLYDPDFQSFYDKKFGGSADPIAVNAGLLEYTQKRIEDKNIEKMSVRAKPSDNAVTYSTDYGVHWGKYDVQVNDMTAQEVLNATYNKKDPTGQHFVVTTNKPVSDNALRVEMQNMVDSDPNAKWKKISLTDTGKLTFKNPVSGETITDGDMTAIYSSGKKIWIEYKTKSEIGGFPTIGVVPMSADILTVLNAKMSGGKKGAGLKETVEAFKKRGIDMSPYVGKVVNTAGGGTGGSRGGSNAVGSAPTITAAQYRAMSVPERTAFRQKKGIIKG